MRSIEFERVRSMG